MGAGEEKVFDLRVAFFDRKVNVCVWSEVNVVTVVTVVTMACRVTAADDSAALCLGLDNM